VDSHGLHNSPESFGTRLPSFWEAFEFEPFRGVQAAKTVWEKDPKVGVKEGRTRRVNDGVLSARAQVIGTLRDGGLLVPIVFGIPQFSGDPHGEETVLKPARKQLRISD
jgi:hypothetical protein